MNQKSACQISYKREPRNDKINQPVHVVSYMWVFTVCLQKTAVTLPRCVQIY